MSGQCLNGSARWQSGSRVASSWPWPRASPSSIPIRTRSSVCLRPRRTCRATGSTTANAMPAGGSGLVPWTTQPLRLSGSLYRLDADRSCSPMASGIGISNSLAWSPDNGTFYFADTLLGTIFAYDFHLETGTLANRRVFATTNDQPGAPDGSTVDEEGYLWNAQWGGWRLVRYAPDGRVDRIVDLPVQQPTCCMFGGPDLRTLYVTSASIGLSCGTAGQPTMGRPCSFPRCGRAWHPNLPFRRLGKRRACRTGRLQIGSTRRSAT